MAYQPSHTPMVEQTDNRLNLLATNQDDHEARIHSLEGSARWIHIWLWVACTSASALTVIDVVRIVMGR
jgi:hypothetical protein